VAIGADVVLWLAGRAVIPRSIRQHAGPRARSPMSGRAGPSPVPAP
jgi:hypothetical protein